jgi:hypothetical protein
MDVVVIAVSLLALMLLGAGLRRPLPPAALPGLFLLMVASVSLGFLAASTGSLLMGLLALAGAAPATAALSVAVHAHDLRLAADGRWRRFEREFWAHVATQPI